MFDARKLTKPTTQKPGARDEPPDEIDLAARAPQARDLLATLRGILNDANTDEEQKTEVSSCRCF